MADNIWKSLQNDVFDQSKEDLIGILDVIRIGKRKNEASILCLLIDKEQMESSPNSVFIYKVRIVINYHTC